MDKSVELALSFINNTERHIFLTGKAGSGKTTFLRSLKNHTHKKMVITAPTGIAAVNASGETLHSLFQLPTSIFLPGETELRINLNSERRLLLRELELLVIDEVSMLRADTLDAIDTVLRNVRKEPALSFGGIQVLYIGDLCQLSPIATREELSKLENCYSSLYFTSAKVFSESEPVCISLEHIHRQTDPTFISILNGIREGKVTNQDIEVLNKCYRKKSPNFSGYVTLVTHNQSADAINAKQLSEMGGELIAIGAEISGEFDELTFPTEKILQLKVGAQVMLLRNDRGNARRYFNGKMGVIHKIGNEKLSIDFGDDEMIDIEKEMWRNIRYEVDKQSGRMEEHEIGSFKQFPIRLAWAITIHKSQGLTFDKVMLDIKNVFASGQAYVAVSRLRSLAGLILNEPLTVELVNSNASLPPALPQSPQQLTEILQVEKITFLKKTIGRKFNWEATSKCIAEANANGINSEIRNQIENTINRYQKISEKFIIEVEGIVKKAGEDLYQTLNNRVQSACQYFSKEINILLENVLTPAHEKSKGSLTQKLQFKFVKDLTTLLRSKKNDFELLQQLVAGPYLHPPILKPARKPRENMPKEKSSVSKAMDLQSTVLVLFNQGVSIKEIADQLNLSVPTVENYLAAFVLSGELQLQQLISEETFKKLAPLLEANRSISTLTLKEKFGDELSFGQINAVLNYCKRISLRD